MKCLSFILEAAIRLRGICLFVFLANSLYAQQPDSIQIKECIPVNRFEDTTWITRFQKSIDDYTDENKLLTDKQCDVLFLGSSSINRWENIHIDLTPLKIIRRSYGGATIRDMIYNYSTIAHGYSPKKIAIYVENDLGGKNSISVGESYDLFRLFFGMLRRDYPDIPIYCISLKPSPRRIAYLQQQQILNLLLKEYADMTPGMEFIDITQGMYDTGGCLREDLFLPDRLHLNQSGYDVWKMTLKQVLR